MLLTTTPTIEGRTITEYRGVVFGEVITGVNIKEMMQRAQALGANAVVGIDLDYETIGQSSSMLMVATSGTAVVI